MDGSEGRPELLNSLVLLLGALNKLVKVGLLGGISIDLIQPRLDLLSLGVGVNSRLELIGIGKQQNSQ